MNQFYHQTAIQQYRQHKTSKCKDLHARRNTHQRCIMSTQWQHVGNVIQGDIQPLSWETKDPR